MWVGGGRWLVLIVVREDDLLATCFEHDDQYRPGWLAGWLRRVTSQASGGCRFPGIAGARALWTAPDTRRGGSGDLRMPPTGAYGAWPELALLRASEARMP